jgi:hypothetical protein
VPQALAVGEPAAKAATAATAEAGPAVSLQESFGAALLRRHLHSTARPTQRRPRPSPASRSELRAAMAAAMAPSLPRTPSSNPTDRSDPVLPTRYVLRSLVGSLGATCLGRLRGRGLMRPSTTARRTDGWITRALPEDLGLRFRQRASQARRAGRRRAARAAGDASTRRQGSRARPHDPRRATRAPRYTDRARPWGEQCIRARKGRATHRERGRLRATRRVLRACPCHLAAKGRAFLRRVHGARLVPRGFLRRIQRDGVRATIALGEGVRCVVGAAGVARRCVLGRCVDARLVGRGGEAGTSARCQHDGHDS